MPSVPVAPPDPLEFSVEDAMLNAWVEDTGDYLRLDSAQIGLPPEPPTSDQS